MFKIYKYIALCLLVTVFVGCSLEETSSSSGGSVDCLDENGDPIAGCDSSSGGGGGDGNFVAGSHLRPLLGVSTSDHLYVRAYRNHDGAEHYTHENTSFDNECRVARGESAIAKKDIECTIEVFELDLYADKLNLEINAPQGMCAYVVTMPYWYWSWEAGRGPTSVSYRVAADGTVSNQTIDGTAGDPDNVILADGSLLCPYDHSQLSDGPNCCVGQYLLTVETEDSSTPGTYTTSVSPSEWGGDRSACINGSGSEIAGRTEAGYPSNEIHLGNDHYNRVYVLDSPRERSADNTFSASYFNPADHAGAIPQAFISNGLGNGNPYWTLACLNESDEYEARIRFHIREWNEVPELLKKGSGNSDTAGNEGDFPDQPMNDIADWKDLIDAYPRDN